MQVQNTGSVPTPEGGGGGIVDIHAPSAQADVPTTLGHGKKCGLYSPDISTARRWVHVQLVNKLAFRLLACVLARSALRLKLKH